MNLLLRFSLFFVLSIFSLFFYTNAISFETEIILNSSGDGPKFIEVGYINNDIYPDILVSQVALDQIWQFTNQQNGVFSSQKIIDDSIDDVYRLRLCDMNNDGANDLVYTARGDDDVKIAINNGSGIFDFGSSIFIDQNVEEGKLFISYYYLFYHQY